MADGIPLTVKWGKETVIMKLIVDGGVKGLKAELEERTGVPADRMKLMPKSKGLWKGVLKEDFDLASIDFKAALQKNLGKKELQILMMGSSTMLISPKKKTVFLEDLPSEEAAKHVAEPSGLVNLGNTCYLNSVVQCLRAIPSLRKGLASYTPSPPQGDQMMANGMGMNQTNGIFISSLRDLYNNLDRTADAVPPSNFVRATRMAFPQFAQLGPQGQPQQQDAEEFYNGLLTIAASDTKGMDNVKKGFPSVTEGELNGAQNLIDAVFGLKMEETLTCDETTPVTTESMQVDDAPGAPKSDEATAVETALVEPPVKSYDLHRKLVCNIQGGADAAATNVSHLAEGIELSLSGKIEKHSDVLGRNAVWTRKQRIARLPPVICVQFGRFYWKQTPDSQDHAGVKCKVMKPVTFNGTVDVYDFCSEQVQKVLKVARDKALKEEDDRINKKLQGELEEKKKSEEDKMDTDDAPPVQKDTDDAPPVQEENAGEEDSELQAALKMSMEEELQPVGPGLPEHFQGVYELFAVVTHKGRDADGGHYMGWVKAESPTGETQKIVDTDEDNEDWFVFDDDEVSACKTEDVLKLKGGGDWHMSYLNFYRAKK